MTETTWQKSACILCECNCGIEVQVEDRRLARIRGDKSHPASEGYTCEKALRLDHYQSRTVRLTSPLRRRPDSSCRTRWSRPFISASRGRCERWFTGRSRTRHCAAVSRSRQRNDPKSPDRDGYCGRARR